ncbi:XrtA/PEP-CTERM system histidine kinase PrsK [Roseomonas sp. CCTCC AB2023176]|uniref:XrtA/PEP-CTERM system histidine kinase PrsK n=1 Tax=Roseomonas sp. CCTCC AB2023176 TaxID=3342640 RepID=UPI0035D6E892
MSGVTASVALHAGSAVVCLVCAALVLVAGRGQRAVLPAVLCLASAAWATAVALRPDVPVGGLAGFAEVLRASLGAAFLVVLCHRLGGEVARPLTRRFAIATLLLGGFSIVAGLPGVTDGLVLPTLGSPVLMGRLGLALLVILIAENLWRNADESRLWHANLPCIALGTLAGFDILIYGNAALSGDFSASLLDARAALLGFAMPLLVMSAVRDRRWRTEPAVSRSVVFHGATFIVAGAFLLAIGALGEGLRRTGYDWGPAAQAALIAGALMALAVALASRSARSWLRRLLVDHFFQARYDYRREWMRTAAILSANGHDAPAPIRAVRAVADAVDSPAGVLLLRDGPSGPDAPRPETLRWAGSWNRPASNLSLPLDHGAVRALGGGVAPAADDPAFAELRGAYGELWLAVPLVHHREGLVGVVLLASPRAPFPVDAEVAELLGTIGREVAMFLSERRAAERLADGRRITEYAKRFAFVAHDVKTVSSQLSLLLANAEDNIDNPEFQRDMLLTVRAAATRIDTLIARLRQDDAAAEPKQDAPTSPATVAPLPRLEALSRRAHPVRVQAEGDAASCVAGILPERFDEAVTHLLDNAVEASPPGVPVTITVGREGDRVVVAIADRGRGMTPEFIRDELFRPLRTTKSRGNGIGAWQARELLRDAGGDLEVQSRPGVGTTMRLVLPVAPAELSASVHVPVAA